MNSPTPRPVIERIVERIEIDVDTGCWLWTGAVSKWGYGKMLVGSRLDGTRRILGVHRLSYQHFIGPIPEGLQIDHVHTRGCRHRHCVNPDHLEAVTQLENARRGLKATQTHCKRGHEFTEENTYRTKRGRECRTCGRERRWKRWRTVTR